LDETTGAEEAGKFFDLRRGALIAPDEGGADDFIAGIEQDRAVHLPGKSDAGDFIAAASASVESAANGQAAGPPPVARILFRPS
jgi:hypothetical protein